VVNPSEMQAAVSLAVAPLVGYQEGAVVSRTLLKRGGGTLTLFAFDAGQALITIAGTSVTVKTGEMVLMPANAPHAVTAPVRFKMLLSMFRSA